MAVNESFLKYAESYSGIDGGDINAEYWFVGMEWSDEKDIDGHYDFIHGKWKEIKKIPEKVDIKENPEDWLLENKMDILYHMLMPEFAEGRTIFGKDSNSFKLNLLPLPFGKTRFRNDWKDENYDYGVKTGFSSFNDYMNGVIETRKNLFAKLLQKSKKPKTIFCFGKSGEDYDYESKFLYALTGETKLKAREPSPESELTQKNARGYNLKVSVYEVNTDEIKRILVCPFPYARNKSGYKIYEYVDDDWKIICDLAKE